MREGMAYFDNAATSFPKPNVVYDYADSFYRNVGGNIGRGGNALSVAAGKVASEAKNNLRKLYRCPAREVAFTSSATDALNRVLLGLDLMEGDHVYISPFEHNSVTRPLNHLVRERGIVLHTLPFDGKTLCPDLKETKSRFKTNAPRLVALTHASNVCGAVVPVDELCSLAKDCGATTLIDMSQTAGLLPLELSSRLYDYAVFAGHKTLLAPFGIGGFFCWRDARLRPVLYGGNGINSIEQYMPSDIVQMTEVGSQNTYAIAGLRAATEWLLERGFDEVRGREREASDKMLSILEGAGARLIGREMCCDSIGVASAVFNGYSPDEMEYLLGKCGVAVRSGIQCSPYAHAFLNTLPLGTVRFSASVMTTERDLQVLKDALDYIRSNG